MAQVIDSDAPAAWLCESVGWWDGRLYEGAKRLRGMETPAGDDASVLFVGREKNLARNYTYGIPIKELEQATHVVLFALNSDVELLVIPADDLHTLRAKLTTDDIDGRLRVLVNYLPISNFNHTTLTPSHAPHLKMDVHDDWRVSGPSPSLAEWFQQSLQR